MNTDDCAGGGWIVDGTSHPCQGALDAQVEIPMGGDAGASYQVTFHFYGIMEPKIYGQGLTRDAGNGRPDLSGGTPTGWASAPGGHSYPSSNYNTYEIHVSNDMGQEVAVYYLNSDTQEGHYTMITDYEKTIEIIGGGSVLVKVFDLNCREIKNCGAQGGAPCDSKARTVDVSAAMPAPTDLDQPGLGRDAGNSGQWFLIDALSCAECSG